MIVNDLRCSFNEMNQWLSSLGLSLSTKKTQAILFSRKRKVDLPDNIILGSDVIGWSENVRYLGVMLDVNLRWMEHINKLKSKANVYLNVLKWIAGSSWGVGPSACYRFVNVTIAAQLEWGANWYTSASKTNVRKVDNILGMAFRVALGLPRNSSTWVGWQISNQCSIEHRTALKTNKFISKVIQLKQNSIKNKLDNVKRIVEEKCKAKRNIPFIIKRWVKIKDLTNELYKWDIHPELSCRPGVEMPPEMFDLESGMLAKNCGAPNRAFSNLINFHKASSDEICIFTDGSKIGDSDSSPRVDAAC